MVSSKGDYYLHTDLHTNYVAKQACSENAQLQGVTYTSIYARIKDMVKDPHIQHERPAEV